MRKVLLAAALLMVGVSGYSQSSSYAESQKTAVETIKKLAFKNNYQYLISFSEVKDASMLVKPETDYLICYVYDNTERPATAFKAYLMTPNDTLKSKYSAVPDDIGQVGAARVERLQFKTGKFAEGKETHPVKLEASPAASIYVFHKSLVPAP